MNHFFSSLPEVENHLLIIGGDLNCVIDPVLDRSSSRVIFPSKRAMAMKELMEEYGLFEPWRFANPNSKAFSFFSSIHQTYSRIDYFLLDTALIPLVRQVTYHSIIISDDAPSAFYLTFLDSPMTHRTWCLNPLLLSNPDLIKLIKEHIGLFIEINSSEETTCGTLWETLKAFLRGHIISFAALCKEIHLSTQSDLSYQIKQLDMQYATSPSPDLYHRRLKLRECSL